MNNFTTLRAALAAGPTESRWQIVECGEFVTKFGLADSDGVSLLTVVDEEGTKFGAIYSEADADYIAAADPATISALLAALDEARRDADRYRWLRGRIPGGAYRIAGVIYSEGGAGVDAAIDAAMKGTP